MTDREAMKMALDVLERASDAGYSIECEDAIEALRQALAQPKQDDEAYGYAKYLAECIWEKHYKEESPHWRPFDNTLSVLTQIDNMTCGLEKAQPEQEPVAWLVSDAQGRYATIRDPAPYGEEVYEPLYAAPPKPEQWTPVEIGVDVTPEGAHVVGMYVLMPQAVRHVFYSQFHPAPKREWVGLTDDEIDWIFGLAYADDMELLRTIEAKLKDKNG